MAKKKPNGYNAPLPLVKIYEAPLGAFRGTFSTDYKSSYKHNCELTSDDITHIFNNLDKITDRVMERRRIEQLPKPVPFTEPL